MAVTGWSLAVGGATAAVILPLLPVDVLARAVGGWVWRQVKLTLVMLSAAWSPGATNAAVFVMLLAVTVLALTALTVHFLQAFARRWNTEWSTLWFAPGDSWQRNFVEKWGRGPASRTVVFVIGNVSMVLFEGLLGASRSSVGSLAAGATAAAAATSTGVATWLPHVSFFSVVQNTFAVLVYISMLLAWWAARLNMLMPSHERALQAATTVAYATSVATMYAYVPESGEGDEALRLDYVQFAILMLINPVPTMVLGYLALKPCLWAAQVRVPPPRASCVPCLAHRDCLLAPPPTCAP